MTFNLNVWTLKNKWVIKALFKLKIFLVGIFKVQRNSVLKNNFAILSMPKMELGLCCIGYNWYKILSLIFQPSLEIPQKGILDFTLKVFNFFS